ARPAALDSHGALFWGYCNVTRNKAKNLSRQWRDFRFVARTDITVAGIFLGRQLEAIEFLK
ncbi:MAG: hypothetical protein J5878_03470, partial [Oscillospiraceae bacterium]|nr:hypothetical protein [Oscillospiraceae bacterium]